MFMFSTFSLVLALLGFASNHKIFTSAKDTPNQITSNVTIVTAWYPHPGYNPKYPDQKWYREFVKDFFSRVKTPLVVFAPSSENEFLQSARPQEAPLVIINDFDTIWDVPEMNPLTRSFHIHQRRLAFQDEVRTNAAEDSSHMYGVWNAKVSFLDLAAKKNPFYSDYFFWHDAAGSIDHFEDTLASWPDQGRVSQLLSSGDGPSDKLLMVVREPKPSGHLDASLEIAPLTRTIAGVFFGGSAEAVHWLSEHYYDMLYYYHSLNQFVGVEEQLLLSIALMYPQRIVGIPCYRCHDPKLQTFAHVYCYLDYLASGNRTEDVLGPLVSFADVPKARFFSHTFLD